MPLTVLLAVTSVAVTTVMIIVPYDIAQGVSCSSAAGQSGRPDWLVSKNAKNPYAPRPSTHHMPRARVCLPAVTAHAGRQSVVAHGKSYSIIDRSRDRQQSRRTAGERRLWQYRFSSERAKYLPRARVCVCSCGVCVCDIVVFEWNPRLREIFRSGWWVDRCI